MFDGLTRRCAAIGAGLLLACSTAPASACRCVTLDQAQAARIADVVVLGDVESISNATGLRRYRIRVVESWKQKVPARLTVVSERTDCMADLRTGRRYLLHLAKVGQAYRTSACSRNLPAEQAAAAVTTLRRKYR